MEPLEEFFGVLGLARHLCHTVDLVEEVPKGDEFGRREPRVAKSYTHFDPVESGLDLLQVSGETTEQPALISLLLSQNTFIDLGVEADKLDVGGDASVNLLIIKGNRGGLTVSGIAAHGVAIERLHRSHQDCRGVGRALLVDHILDDAGEPFCALDKLVAEALVGRPHVLLAEMAAAVGVGHAAN